MKRRGKRCAIFLKRAARKEKLANLDTVLQRVLQDHGETTTIGELRAMVGREVGVTLEGKHRAPFRQGIVQTHRPAAHPAPSPSSLQDSQQTRQTRRDEERLGRALRGRGL